MNDELPCLDLLEATPAILRGLMSEISDEDARWKPAPDRFSIAEVLAHLSHSEGHCYRARVDRFLAEEMPEFEPDDAQMHLELYKNGDPEEDFGHFEDQRETNIELLRGLPAEAGSRKAHASRGGRDHALADAARVGAARFGARPADRGAGAGAEVPGGRGPAGRGLPAEAMTVRPAARRTRADSAPGRLAGWVAPGQKTENHRRARRIAPALLDRKRSRCSRRREKSRSEA